ncbi:MAG: hypothetical protein AB1782_07350, partial [Cyanobacteriota bacterium]
MDIIFFKKKTYGNSLSQYTNVIVLIALALIPVFYICGQILIKNYSNFSSGLKNNELNNTSGQIITIQAHELNGTPDKPVSKCSGGMCSIDYGSFVLNGIPQNFDEFVQTGGTSGGSDKLAELVMQIAEQLEKNGDSAGAAEFRNLANISHFIADLQKQTEQMAQSCQSETDPVSCFNSKLQAKPSVLLPDNISSLLPDYDPADREHTSMLNILSLHTVLGNARNESIEAPWVLGPETKNKYAAFKANIIYDSIKNNSKFSDTLKGVATELYKQIDSLAINLYVQTQAYSNSNGAYRYQSYNPVDGKTSEIIEVTSSNGMNDIIKPQYNKNTNLRAILLCASGYNKDSGNDCK